MVDEVVSGKSDYAISRPTSMIDISKGQGIVYLAAIYQSSPLILLADKSSGITTIKDFKDKKIMSIGDLNTDTSILSMMFSQGISLKDFEVLKPSFNPKDLLDKKTDLMASYISNEPFVLKELGGEPVIFNPKDYGFDFYNDILITSKEHLKNFPDEVKRFREASIRGWEYAFENIDESVDILYNRYNTQNKSKEALKYEANELKKLAFFATSKIGNIEINKLEKIYNVYKLLGLVQNEINLKNIIYNEYSIDVELTDKEKKYLENKKEITICIDPNWMPFESFDANGNYVGMSADYFKIIEKNLATKFEVIKTKTWSESVEAAKSRKCDIMSLVMKTPQRLKYLNFTTPYLKIPLVITTKLDVPFINSIEDLNNEKVGIPKGYAFLELLRNKYPNLNIVEVKDIDDGLDKVNHGDIFAYIGTLASVGYKFQTKYSGELKIAGKIEEKWELGIGVRNDDAILLNIMQKSINSITQDGQRDILNKWISIKYEKGTDYSLVWKILAFFSFVSILFIYWNNRLRVANKKLEELNEELYKTQLELEKIAVTDKLTNLYNRHKLDKVLETEKKRADRYNSTFGVIILDIDHFKTINDTFGHYTGDVVISGIASILLSHSRETDVIGRWGGEEFLIVIPQTNKDELIKFAELLKEAIKRNDFGIKHTVSASFGASLYKKNESIEKVVSKADNALYISKNSGRDRVSFQA